MANTRSAPSGIRNWSTTINEQHSSPVFNYLFDAATIFTPIGKPPITGSWRPLVPADLAANISLSGVSLTIGSVAVTGGQVAISNPVTVGGGFLGITGTTNVNVANSIVPVSGIVTSVVLPSTTVSTSTPSGTFGTILAANSSRKQWFIQNLGTGYLFVKLGVSASENSFNFVLKGASSSIGYDGSIFSDDGARWRGVVSVSGYSTPSYISWELT